MNDERFYEKVSGELRTGQLKEGLWMKCLVESEGKEESAKILYVKTRVTQLVHAERQKAKRAQQKAKRAQPMPLIGRMLDYVFNALFFWAKKK
jgi:hypothetical protein